MPSPNPRLAHLTPAQMKSYDKLVVDLRAAKSPEDRIKARERAMEEGPSDLLYVKWAMSLAEAEVGTPEAKWRLVQEDLESDGPPIKGGGPKPKRVEAHKKLASEADSEPEPVPEEAPVIVIPLASHGL